MNEKVKELLNPNTNLIIPNYVIKYYTELELDNLEFLLLIYLINQKENVIFDLDKISKSLNFESNKVLELINNLNEKNYISIEMKKTNGIIEEYISTELFYNKIMSLITSSKNSSEENSIYDIFEREFGRTLSPVEYETINNWIESKISKELIKEALKEAVLNGVNNLRYIDKILFEWNKKGYKNVEDIKKNKYDKDEDHVEELFDYDWINDD